MFFVKHMLDNDTNKYSSMKKWFDKEWHTIDHLVTLQMLTKESCLKGKGLYGCFIKFKKAFDMVPC